MADFEKNYPGIAAQELWKLFLCKVEEQNLGRDFISAVGEVCAIGLNLSKYIVRFFPTYTLHNETHSANVCRWMWVLLGKEGRKMLTAHEAALLLMAACCHDIGMSVSEEQENEMRSRNYPGWDTYFRENLADDAEYCRTGEISDRMLRNFVRMHHHERIGENLRESDWPDALLMEELDREVLLKLCRSHGTELTDADLNCREGLYDLRMCAVLLRLADLLDFDAGRTPEVLFRQMGLECPKDAESWRSAEEHQKNRAGKFRESFVNGCIPYVAVYDNPGVEQEIRKYLDWVDAELTKSRNCLSQSASHWKSLDLPYKVDDENVKRKGYAAGKFCMTMDQDRVLDLLTGENLYSDAGVFVRELLQNSIDAVLMRAKQDPDFRLEDGLIQIDTWMDEEANTWFRIRDNGTGMNKHIIQNHFLKVGNSYYTSEEFKYANRHAPKGSYTAISRFGIGILSCFMGDKEYTQLKVSTKRFGEGPKNGIRLDVTGLHGYYFLCNEKDHPEYEDWFPKMPAPGEEDRGYRQEPGTTICVNTNLLRMGELRSIREILDKYVQFPEVRVTYNGSDGYKEYPTQQELMDAVYALNPDGVVKEYVHEISDELFQRIRQSFPIVAWRDKPYIVLRYHPMEWLSDSKNMTGIAVSVGVRYSAHCQELILKNHRAVEETVHPYCRMNVRFKNVEGLVLNTQIERLNYREYQDPEGKLQQMVRGISIELPLFGGELPLSDEEKNLLLPVANALQSVELCYSLLAYNGVLASDCDPLRIGFDDNAIRSVLLLRGSFLPEVNLERNTVSSLNPEAVCCLSMAYEKLPCVGKLAFSRAKTLRMFSERQMWEILEAHPLWSKELRDRKRMIRIVDTVYELLWLAEWKRSNVVYLTDSESRYGSNIRIGEKRKDQKTADFPVGMFFWLQEKVNSLAQPMVDGMYVYNLEHPFSQWLITQREVFEKRLPAIYDTIIQAMLLSYDAGNTIITINNILTHLRSFDNNCLGIYDDLFLTEKDFGN